MSPPERRAPGAPTRILMTADTVGGVFTYALELARLLGDSGTDVLLATMGRPMDRAQRDALAPLRSGASRSSKVPSHSSGCTNPGRT